MNTSGTVKTAISCGRGCNFDLLCTSPNVIPETAKQSGNWHQNDDKRPFKTSFQTTLETRKQPYKKWTSMFPTGEGHLVVRKHAFLEALAPHEKRKSWILLHPRGIFLIFLRPSHQKCANSGMQKPCKKISNCKNGL